MPIKTSDRTKLARNLAVEGQYNCDLRIATDSCGVTIHDMLVAVMSNFSHLETESLNLIRLT